METLSKKFDLYVSDGFIPLEIPLCISDNLNHQLRPYQKEAYARFIFYTSQYKNRAERPHLLYHMATGSGKTLVMAGLIMYLYTKGYRNFLFFVNSTNILKKTKENFLNPLSSKYLFKEKTTIEGQEVFIKEVTEFDSANKEDINIHFSTVQGLHERFNNPKENCITYEDFKDKRIVLISDEAHHINALTKKTKELSKGEAEDLTSWENTVTKIFEANENNIMLEFTATLELNNLQIAQKYSDKIIFDYSLKKFREDGYSKEVKTLQADLPPVERAIQGIILSQYRLKIFNKYGQNIKPVILIKSKDIKESQKNEQEFHETIRNLNVAIIQNIQNINKNNDVIQKAFDYFASVGMTHYDLIDELKNDFVPEKCISVNSKNDSEEKQLIVNSLEDENNEYRVVFAVDMLNEGWDVLNLFDIIRLYETRDAKGGQPGKTTVAEAQLIGRGARYCPFKTNDNQEKFQRKYDQDITNELKVCEELHYHSSYNPRYIQELNTALIQTGIIPNNIIEQKLELKEEFINTDFYKKTIIILNQRFKNENHLPEFRSPVIKKEHNYTIRSRSVKETTVFGNNLEMIIDEPNRQIKFKNLGMNIIQKAIYSLNDYKFSNLKQFFPRLNTFNEFITSEEYFGDVIIHVTGSFYKDESLQRHQKFEIAKYVLTEISKTFKTTFETYIGTKRFAPMPIKEVFLKEKYLRFNVSTGTDKELGKKTMRADIPKELAINIDAKTWYAYKENFGTSEEKFLVKFIDSKIIDLETKFTDIYLLRNERFFQIYRFADGKAIEPDFVLFLTEKETNKDIHYQLFIEPKGEHLLENDKWKEDFLVSIEKEYEPINLFNDKDFKLIGLPFFNEKQRKSAFNKKLNKKIGIQ